VVPQKFLAGEYPRNYDEKSSLEKISALLEAGVTCFVDLTDENDGLKAYDYLACQLSKERIAIKHCPIPDLSIPASPGFAKKILDIIDAEIEKNGLVYVHCWGGVGRTGTIVGCWLARHGFKNKNALRRLSSLWKKCPKSINRNSPETPDQIEFVRNWDEGKPCKWINLNI